MLGGYTLKGKSAHRRRSLLPALLAASDLNVWFTFCLIFATKSL